MQFGGRGCRASPGGIPCRRRRPRQRLSEVGEAMGSAGGVARLSPARRAAWRTAREITAARTGTLAISSRGAAEASRSVAYFSARRAGRPPLVPMPGNALPAGSSLAAVSVGILDDSIRRLRRVKGGFTAAGLEPGGQCVPKAERKLFFRFLRLGSAKRRRSTTGEAGAEEPATSRRPMPGGQRPATAGLRRARQRAERSARRCEGGRAGHGRRPGRGGAPGMTSGRRRSRDAEEAVRRC